MDILCLGKTRLKDEKPAAVSAGFSPGVSMLGHALNLLKLWRLDYAYLGESDVEEFPPPREDDDVPPVVILADFSCLETLCGMSRRYPDAVLVLLAETPELESSKPPSGWIGPIPADYLLFLREGKNFDPREAGTIDLSQIPFILSMDTQGSVSYQAFDASGKRDVSAFGPKSGSRTKDGLAGKNYPVKEVFAGVFSYCLYWGMDFDESVDFALLAVALAEGGAANDGGGKRKKAENYPDLDEMLAAYEKYGLEKYDN